MLLFGHTGIALGAAVLAGRVVGGSRFSKSGGKRGASGGVSQAVSKPEESQGSNGSRLNTLVSRIDMRLLLVGSLLPDIVDKPVGLFLFGETFSNGRIFCHTLLFLILLSVAGVSFYRSYGKTWLLALFFGTLTHLVFDQMWRAPRTLFWPLFGLSFERADVSNWTSDIYHRLFTEPSVYIPEIAGAIILAWFTLTLVRRRNVNSFIRHGRI